MNRTVVARCSVAAGVVVRPQGAADRVGDTDSTGGRYHCCAYPPGGLRRTWLSGLLVGK